jgi:hypothetical protein
MPPANLAMNPTSLLAGELDALRAAGEESPEPVAQWDVDVSEAATPHSPHSNLSSPANYPDSVTPSSGASRHLLPRGEKGPRSSVYAMNPTSPLVGEVDAPRAAGEGSPKLVDQGSRNASEASTVWPPHSNLPCPTIHPGAVAPSSGAARHLLPRGEKGPRSSVYPMNPTSPLVGEVDALRAAGEGSPEPVAQWDVDVSEAATPHSPHSNLSSPANHADFVTPSSGASRHLLPLGEKGSCARLTSSHALNFPGVP